MNAQAISQGARQTLLLQSRRGCRGAPNGACQVGRGEEQERDERDELAVAGPERRQELGLPYECTHVHREDHRAGQQVHLRGAGAVRAGLRRRPRPTPILARASVSTR